MWSATSPRWCANWPPCSKRKPRRKSPTSPATWAPSPSWPRASTPSGGCSARFALAPCPLRRTALDADALVALLGCVPEFVTGVGEAVDSSGAWLAGMGLGLGDAAGAARNVSGPLKQVSGVLDMGIDVAEGAVSMLAPGEWRGLIAALDRLSASLKALKAPTPPANPAAPTASGAALSEG